MFVIGAIFALAVGIPIFILFLFYNPGLTPAGQLYNLFFRIATVLNGIGYYIVGRDINKNHGIVLLGIIGKIIIFIFFLVAFFQLLNLVFE